MVKQLGLLEEGDRVLVALSGGPDSVALLHVLAELRSEYGLTLGAVYVNHGIRPTAARREERLCAELCEELGVELDIVRADIPARAREVGAGLEETGRKFRYRQFERLAEENGYTKIAVGHHADDQAETVLFRVLRGTGRKGLAGIPAQRERIIRPLLQVSREEILKYLRRIGAEYCEDRTNKDRRYRRNYVRHRLIPLLEREINPNIRRALVALGETSADEEEYLNRVVSEAISAAVARTPGGKIELDLKRLAGYDRWIRRRLLRYCMSLSSTDGTVPDRDVIGRLEELIDGDAPAMSLPNGLEASVTGRRLVIYRRRAGGFHLELPVPGTAAQEWPRLNWRVVNRRRESGKPALHRRRTRKVSMDREKVRLPLEVRNIRPGDRFRPLGLGGTKKIGDYLTDRRVAQVYRDEIAVVCDRDGIIWLAGWELSDRVKIDATTREVMTVEFSERLPDEAETV